MLQKDIKKRFEEIEAKLDDFHQVPLQEVSIKKYDEKFEELEIRIKKLEEDIDILLKKSKRKKVEENE